MISIDKQIKKDYANVIFKNCEDLNIGLIKFLIWVPIAFWIFSMALASLAHLI